MSFFDHEDHEHDENCGHSKEQHLRIKQKMEAFMDDVAEDLFSDQDLANLYEVIQGRLRDDKMSATMSNLKAFNAGFEFGIYAAGQNNNSIGLIAGMKRISRLKQEEVSTLAKKALEKQDDNETSA